VATARPMGTPLQSFPHRFEWTACAIPALVEVDVLFEAWIPNLAIRSPDGPVAGRWLSPLPP
jgi:hypothetical protein